MYGDPHALRARARELDLRADDVDRTAAGLRSRAHATQWVSSAAEAHRAHVDTSARALETAADHLRAAADELRRHADRLQEVLDAIAHAERVAAHWFSAAQSWVSAGLHAVEGAVVGAFHHLTGSAPVPPWHGWRWTPGSLPVPGHVDWLDVLAHVEGRSWRP